MTSPAHADPARRAHIAPAQRGYTLVELIIAVVVVGVVTSIALPSYKSYVLRANRAAAKAALVDVSAREESYFVDRKTYNGDLTKLGLSGAFLSRDGSMSATETTGQSIYKITVGPTSTTCAASTTAPGSSGYMVVATPLGAQLSRDTDCPVLCLTSAGVRMPAASSSSCWIK